MSSRIVARCPSCNGAICRLASGRLAPIHLAVAGPDGSQPCPVWLAGRYVPLAFRQAFSSPTTAKPATGDGGFATWLARHRPGKGYQRQWRTRLLVWRAREGLD